MPVIIRRRFERIEQLKQSQTYLAVTIGGVSIAALLILMKLAKIKKTFIRGIYYTPSTNSLDFHVHKGVGSRLITGVTPADLKITETLATNNRVDRRFVVAESAKFRGYSYFGYPSKSQWKAKDIFDAWLEDQR